jgi:hypothetical protein
MANLAIEVAHMAGPLSLLSAWSKAKAARWTSEAQRHQTAGRMQESLLSRVRQLEDDWIANVGEPERELDWSDRKEMLTQAQKFYRENPFVRNGVGNLVNYVMGTGVSFQHENQRALDQWAKWANDPANMWDDREKSILRRALRDGDVFLRFFGAGPSTQLRFINAESVREPALGAPATESWSNGIITEARDVETVLGYWVDHGTDGLDDFERIDNPSEIIHYAYEWDGNTKRGESLILPAMRSATRLEQAYTYQFETLRLRLAIAMVEKLRAAAPSDITDWNSGDDSSRSNQANANFIKAFRPGTILTGNDGVEHQFISPQLDAGDVIAFFREYKLAIASAMGTPEFMVTSDASNANFASTMVAESPFLRKVTAIRDSLGWVFRSVFERVTGYGDATIEWGRLEARDFANDAKAFVMLNAGGIVDKRSVQERLDFDPEVVGPRLAEENADDLDNEENDFEEMRQTLSALDQNEGNQMVQLFRDTLAAIEDGQINGGNGYPTRNLERG